MGLKNYVLRIMGGWKWRRRVSNESLWRILGSCRQIGFVDFIVTKINLVKREPKPNLRVQYNIYFLGTMCAFVCT